MINRPEEPSDRPLAESQLSELQNMRVLLEEARGLPEISPIIGGCGLRARSASP
jgi:hypothetical protein